MSADKRAPEPERSERAYLVLRERSEVKSIGVWFFAQRAKREDL